MEVPILKISKIILILFIFLILTFHGCQKSYKENQDLLTEKSLEHIIQAAQNEFFNFIKEKSPTSIKYALIGMYKKMEYIQYDNIGIINFQIEIEPIVYLKGNLGNQTIYVNVHSANMSGFGHSENYGRLFVIFLSEDEYNDRHFAEVIDFIKAKKLPDYKRIN